MQPQKRGLEQRRPVRESRPAGQRQTPPKRAGQQCDAPMESPDDGPGWWRAKLRPLLQRANERGYGAGMLNSVLEEMMAHHGGSRGGARDVPTSAPIETADGAKLGQWVNTQRKSYKKGQLSPEQWRRWRHHSGDA